MALRTVIASLIALTALTTGAFAQDGGVAAHGVRDLQARELRPPGDAPGQFEQAPYTGPRIHRQTVIVVPRYALIDFDDGSNAVSNIDFRLSESAGSLVLTPVGGRVWIGSATPRGYAACAAGTGNYIAAPVGLPAARVYACYITSAGRVGELRVDQRSPQIILSYSTWQLPPANHTPFRGARGQAE